MTASMRLLFLKSMIAYLIGFSLCAFSMHLMKVGPDEFFSDIVVTRTDPGFVAEAAGGIGLVILFGSSILAFGTLLPPPSEPGAWLRRIAAPILLAAGLCGMLLLQQSPFWFLKAMIGAGPSGALLCVALILRTRDGTDALVDVFD